MNTFKRWTQRLNVLMLVTIFVPFIQALFSAAQTVQAVAETPILTSAAATATASYTVVGDTIQWTVNVARTGQQASKIALAATGSDGQALTLQGSQLSDQTVGTQAYAVENTAAQGATTVTFTTPVSSPVTLSTALLDAQGQQLVAPQTTALQPVATVATVARASARMARQAAATEESKSINSLLPKDANGLQTIFTDAAITDRNGAKIDTVQVGEQILLTYGWAIPESVRSQIKAGDTFEFNLPQGFQVSKELTGALADATGTVFGNFIVNTDGSAVITFTDAVQNHSEIKGSLYVNGTAAMNDDGSGKNLTIPFVDQAKATVPPYAENKSRDISKKAISQTANGDIKDDKADVEWQIAIDPNNQAFAEGTTVVDTLPAGVTLDQSKGMTVEVADEWQDGSEHNEKSIDFDKVFTVAHTGQTVTFKFKDGADLSKHYTIAFHTQVDLATVRGNATAPSVIVKNQASLKEPGHGPIDTEATTTFANDTKFDKQGKLQANGVIAWTVHVTQDGLSIPDQTVWQDEMNNDQVLTDVDGNALSDDQLASALDVSGDGPKMTVSGANGKYAFKIAGKTTKDFSFTYYTKSTTQGTQSNFDLTNTISWDGNHTSTGKIHNESGVVKSAGELDTSKHTVPYTVTINGNNLPLTKATLVDAGSNGITYSDDQLNALKVTRYAKGSDQGTEVSKDQYTVSASADGFTLDLNQAVVAGTTDRFVVTYTAHYDGSKKGDAQTNRVDYQYQTNGYDFTGHAEVNINPGALTKVGLSKGGVIDPSQGAINWTINLNPNADEQLGPNAKLVDTLPTGVSLAGVDMTATTPQQVPSADFSVTSNPGQANLTATYDPASRQLTFTGFAQAKASYLIGLTTTIDRQVDGTLPNVDVTNNADYSDEAHNGSHADAHVSYNPTADLITKAAVQNSDDAKALTYTLTIDPDTATNPAGDNKLALSDVVVTDTPDSKTLLIDPQSVKVTTKDGKAYPAANYELDSGEQGFTLAFKAGVTITEELHVTYAATILIPAGTRGGQTVTPSNIATIKGNQIGGTTDGNHVELTTPDAGGDAQGVLGSITITKVDAQNQKKRLEGAEFSLYHADGDKTCVVSKATTDANGQLTVPNLTFGQYRLVEEKAPEGYAISDEMATGKLITVGATTDGSVTDESANPDITITNDVTTSVCGRKTWSDADNQDGIRPKSIEVLLYQGTGDAKKQVQAKTVSAKDNWKYSFESLRKYDNDGQLIQYSIGETPVDGYDTASKDNNLTNSHTPEVVNLEGTKTWDDHENRDASRPEQITVYLLADGKRVAQTTTNAEKNWKYTFTNQPKYVKGAVRQPVIYTVEEDSVTGYTTKADGLNLTNTEETTSLTGHKTWHDGANTATRPAHLVVRLYKNGAATDQTVTTTAKDDWTYKFGDLQKVDNEGKAIRYSVKEETDATTKAALSHYQAEATTTTQTGDGWQSDLANKAIVAIAGQKHWDDFSNLDGARPSNIVVQLLQNGQVIKSTVVSGANDWQYRFDQLDRYDAQGKAYVYSVAEQTQTAGYSAKVALGRQTDQYGDFTGKDITNVYRPTVALSGKKRWADADNAAGIRPTSIQIGLFQDQSKTPLEVQTVTAATGWAYSFAALPKYNSEGEAHQYHVAELNTDTHYRAISGLAQRDSATGDFAQADVTNTAVENVSGTKSWHDFDNRYQSRPASITVDLLQNGFKIASQSVSAATNWHYAFTNLDRYDAQGQTYTYTVREANTPSGYVSQVAATNETDNLVTADLTNDYQPLTTVAGTKHWRDHNNAANTRPATITVQLWRQSVTAARTLVATKQVSAATGWQYQFTQLPKLDAQGNVYQYAVTEANVPAGYTVSRNGYDLTNTLTPKTPHHPHTPKNRLPQTGVQSSPLLMVLGVLMLSSTAVAWQVSKRRI